MSNLAQNLEYTGTQDFIFPTIFTSEFISPSVDSIHRTGGNNVIYLFNREISSEIKSAYEQLAYIQKFLGLNRLALASVLQISRPTLYEWLDSKVDTIRKKNQERLYAIYEISQTWASKNLGLVNGYLHKPIGSAQYSLFALLKADVLNIPKIEQCLAEIEKFIIKKREKDKVREDLLLNHGFEPVSREDMDDRLNDLFFRNE